MKTVLPALICAATAAPAWEFTPGLPCRLTHETAEVQVELTHDPTQPLYTITLRQAAPWPGGAIFSLQFTGSAPLTISTDRHQISPDGTALTVTDRGFGNVLNGLQFNSVATGRLGDKAVSIPLAGAAEPVERFRRCEVAAGA
ncbi:hypothetical protein [uncultured Roseobacter sp.]|uniref:hypothetical protein n=1 Tax=uncultured Roseobacter sp. TaxID=114847 RepID=UPI002637ED6E|nr:hypothetical protein [uncultured Roseobacter sp.]